MEQIIATIRQIKPETEREAFLLKAIEMFVAYIEELETRLGLNSKNSSKPPSSDFMSPRAKKEQPSADQGDVSTENDGPPRKRGGQKGHAGHGRHLLPIEQVDRVEEHRPPTSCPCGGAVRIDDEPAHVVQVYELPPVKLEVIEHRTFGGVCEECGRKHFGDSPEPHAFGIFGPRLAALIVSLTTIFRLSRALAQAFLRDVFGFRVAISTISKLEYRITRTLEPAVSEIEKETRQGPVVYVDETGGRRGDELVWTWVLSCPARKAALFRFGKRRSRSAYEELLDFQSEHPPEDIPIHVTDRYAVYSCLPDARHQFCWAHLKREFRRYAEQAGDAGAVGRKLLHATNRLFTLWDARKNEHLDDTTWREAMKDVMQSLRFALQEGAGLPHTWRNRHESMAGFCSKLLMHFDSLWVFVDSPGVEPTNNEAERRLRPAVVHRKISYGTQSDRGDRFLENTYSIIETCKMHARSAFNFFQHTFEAFIRKEPSPSLFDQG